MLLSPKRGIVDMPPLIFMSVDIYLYFITVQSCLSTIRKHKLSKRRTVPEVSRDRYPTKV